MSAGEQPDRSGSSPCELEEPVAKMRVAIQTPWLPRPHGGMTVLFEYGNGLARRGHDVTMILTRMGHGVPEGVETVAELRALEWLSADDALTCVDGSRADAVATLRPDVLLRFSSEPLAGPPPWAAREFVVVQALQVLPPEFEEALLAYPAPKLCVSRWLADAVLADSAAYPVLHLPSGIDHDRFNPAAGTAHDRPIDVLMIYNPAPTKAVRVGVGATELLRASRPDLRVEMFGGFQRPAWLSDDIAYHHQPVRSELVELYRRSKTFMLSSALEGFGLASLEAMACGAALVTTDNGGSADYAEHEANSLVAPVGDHAALASALDRLLNNPRLRDRLAAAGGETAARYRWEATIDELERILTH